MNIFFKELNTPKSEYKKILQSLYDDSTLVCHNQLQFSSV